MPPPRRRGRPASRRRPYRAKRTSAPAARCRWRPGRRLKRHRPGAVAGGGLTRRPLGRPPCRDAAGAVSASARRSPDSTAWQTRHDDDPDASGRPRRTTPTHPAPAPADTAADATPPGVTDPRRRSWRTPFAELSRRDRRPRRRRHAGGPGSRRPAATPATEPAGDPEATQVGPSADDPDAPGRSRRRPPPASGRTGRRTSHHRRTAPTAGAAGHRSSGAGGPCCRLGCRPASPSPSPGDGSADRGPGDTTTEDASTTTTSTTPTTGATPSTADESPAAPPPTEPPATTTPSTAPPTTDPAPTTTPTTAAPTTTTRPPRTPTTTAPTTTTTTADEGTTPRPGPADGAEGARSGDGTTRAGGSEGVTAP